MTTAGELRRIAERILSQIEGMDDDQKIETRSNTYGMDYSILETPDGFIDYYEIEPEIEYDEYDDDDDY